ncbi:MAG: hypothetical protein K2H38_11550 [Muribaculaceae bacterium]|nr:hypothetical protein [Muribaculaceae bacterium]
MKTKLTLLLLVLCTCMPFAVKSQYAGKHYIMHGSGLHLAKSSKSGILESATVANPQIMNITEAGNGYYRIQAPDGSYFAKSGANAWNTGFITSDSGDAVLFQFEESGQFLKIKNKASGKYLGVDDVTDGSSIFCDKDGSNSKHLWYLADNVNGEMPETKYDVMVNPGAPRQVFDGWGISLCWWAHMCGSWPEDKIDTIIDWLVLPENLNYSVFRYNIGGGDDPNNTNCDKHHMGKGKGLRAEMPGFKLYEDSEYDWTADEAQIKIMRKIKERRPDAIFEAFSNSAPWWMTKSGCCSGAKEGGKDNLKPEYYEAFADYLIDVMVHFKEAEGIEFATIAPFNEPMTNFWHSSGVQEGCHFDMQSMSDFIKVLHPKLKASGLNTIISGCDETAVGQQTADVKHFKKDGSLGFLGQINTHTYQGSVQDCCALSALCAAEGIPLWMSEVGSGGSGIQGNLNMACRLIRDIRYIEPLVWCDWQYFEEGNDQWCLLQGNFSKATMKRVNNYYVRQHFTQFIKPGYTILTSTNDNTLAATNPEGNELVLVVVNPDAVSNKYSVDLGLYESIGLPVTAIKSQDNNYNQEMAYEITDSYLTFDLEGLTIATFVIPVESSLSSELTDGSDYYILPRRSATCVVTGTDGTATLQPASMEDNQIWKASIKEGKVRFTNRKGETLNAGTGYALSCSENPSGTEYFTLTSVGQQYFKIEASGKAFDLESDNSNAGTKVGMWNYGTDPASATHRQWRFLPIAKRSNITLEQNGVDKITEDSNVYINVSKGMIHVSAPKAGKVVVTSIDGCIVYSSITDEATIELASGIYAVLYTGTTKHTSQLVRVP